MSTFAPHFERWLAAICLLLCLASLLSGAATTRASSTETTSGLRSIPDIHSRATRTSDVQFDSYSLIIHGQRVILYSGEFHTFRLPVPSLWPDILQKVKAAGFNGISVYTHMGLINPSRGVVDFRGFRSLQALFDAAKESGIWIILRPGPYINAETTAGGIAHWITTEIAGEPRTNASDYRAAWQDYIKGIIDVTSPNQISSGGPVIAIQVDNEFSQSPATHAEYFVELEEVYHNSPIDVPLTYNDPGMGSNFINGTGAVDLYGFDEYPQRYDCTHQTWQQVATNYYSYHAQVDPSQPQFIPEFQSGAPDAWGLTSPGYEGCRLLTGPEFLSVSNLNLWAANAKMMNFYMFYGGTSWGGLPYPGIYTSYDYGATIAENRVLTTKFDEMKRQGMFLRSSPEFYKTDWVADTNVGLAISTNSESYITELRNPDTNAGFFIARQVNSTSISTINFKLSVTTSLGTLQIPLIAPQITLSGRQSKVIVTDYSFGASSKALYSTAPIFFAGVIDGRDVLFLYGDEDQAHEVTLQLTGTPSSRTLNSPFLKMSTGYPGFAQDSLSKTTILTISPGSQGLNTIWDSDTQLILFADTQTAATFWSPIIAAPSSTPFRNYWGIGTNESILVGGPYLVRNASVEGGVLALRGDLELTNGTDMNVKLSVIAPRSVKRITWNGQPVTINPTDSSALTSRGGFVGHIQPRTTLSSIEKLVPKLNQTGWKYKDSLPEVSSDGFDDSGWVLADHRTTNIPYAQYYGDGRVLYGCDYGFCENIIIWRGHFKATGLEKSVNLSLNGGEGFAASVWLNDVYLDTYGNSLAQEFNETFIFPPGAIKPGKDNIITVLQDNMGLDENGYSSANVLKSPRGIRGFQLDAGGKFTEWRVQGKVGGYKAFPDKTRGVLNEGGLYGERKGWHLPGFLDHSSPSPSPSSAPDGWVARPLSAGLPSTIPTSNPTNTTQSKRGKAGVGFFINEFSLDIPENVDAMMSLVFSEPLGQAYRARVFVNGWMMGMRIGSLGPQAKFPVHEGIWEYRGKNTVVVALWSMTDEEPISPDLELVLDVAFEGGVGHVRSDNPRWSAVGRE